MSALTFAAATTDARPLTLVAKDGLDDWLATLDAQDRAWVDQAGFEASAGAVLLIPGDGGIKSAVEPAKRVDDVAVHGVDAEAPWIAQSDRPDLVTHVLAVPIRSDPWVVGRNTIRLTIVGRDIDA